MKKVESSLIYIVIALVCPFLLFIFFWWVTAFLVITDVLPIPEGVIVASAFTGLVIGIVLDIRYLKKWHARFYTEDMLIMAFLYLGCSIIAVAVFMGLPVGNLVLGTLAGVYLGRRLVHTKVDAAAVPARLVRVSLFTALVTGLESFPIGLLALNEIWVMEWLQKVTRMSAKAAAGIPGIGLIAALCLVLMVIQFWFTKIAARFALGKV